MPPHDPVLVLNGLLDTETNVKVVISHSVDAFSNNVPSFIRNANVTLWQDDLFIDSLKADMTDLVYVFYDSDNSELDSLPMYYYKSNFTPQKNQTYTVEVSHPDYPSVYASTYVPEDMVVYDIDIDTTLTDERIGLTFSFDDNAYQENYYRLKLFSSCKKVWEDYDGYIQEIDFRGDVVFMSNDLSFPSNVRPFDLMEGSYSFYGDRVVFSDALFNGQKKTITIDVETELKYADCDTIMIRFSTFSDDTYSYYNSLIDHSGKGELGLFGGEVIPVYSNVENGLGVLISTNAQKIYLKP